MLFDVRCLVIVGVCCLLLNACWHVMLLFLLFVCCWSLVAECCVLVVLFAGCCVLFSVCCVLELFVVLVIACWLLFVWCRLFGVARCGAFAVCRG